MDLILTIGSVVLVLLCVWFAPEIDYWLREHWG